MISFCSEVSAALLEITGFVDVICRSVFCTRIWAQVGTAPEDTLSKTQTSEQEEE
jgi:hypothetical protein